MTCQDPVIWNQVIVQSQLVMACVGKDLILWGCQCGTLQILKTFKSAPSALLADVASQRVLVGCLDGHLELVKVNDMSSVTFMREKGWGRVQSIQAFWDDEIAVVAFHNHDSRLAVYSLTHGVCLKCLRQPVLTQIMQIAVGFLGQELRRSSSTMICHLYDCMR